MVVLPNFIKEHLKAHRDRDNLVVIGYRYRLLNRFSEFFSFINPLNVSINSQNIKNLPTILDDRERIYKVCNSDLSKLSTPWICLYSNNFSIKRKDLLKVGGFCEDFQKKWGVEDVEFGYRLYKKGLNFLLCRKAKAYHLWHPMRWKKNLTELQKKSIFIF